MGPVTRPSSPGRLWQTRPTVSMHLPGQGCPSVWLGRGKVGKLYFGVLSMEGHVFLSLDAVGSPGKGHSCPPAQGDQPSPESNVQSLGNQGSPRFGGGHKTWIVTSALH